MPNNLVSIVGNLTDDPELRYTGNGHAVANLTVAVSSRVRRNGSWEQVQDGFFRCNVWRSLAENVAETLHKGDRVVVVGKLKQRNWTDNDENRRTSIEIEAAHIAPDLSFATAALTKSTKASTTDEPEDDSPPSS